MRNFRLNKIIKIMLFMGTLCFVTNAFANNPPEWWKSRFLVYTIDGGGVFRLASYLPRGNDGHLIVNFYLPSSMNILNLTVTDRGTTQHVILSLATFINSAFGAWNQLLPSSLQLRIQEVTTDTPGNFLTINVINDGNNSGINTNVSQLLDLQRLTNSWETIDINPQLLSSQINSDLEIMRRDGLIANNLSTLQAVTIALNTRLIQSFGFLFGYNISTTYDHARIEPYRTINGVDFSIMSIPRSPIDYGFDVPWYVNPMLPAHDNIRNIIAGVVLRIGRPLNNPTDLLNLFTSLDTFIFEVLLMRTNPNEAISAFNFFPQLGDAVPFFYGPGTRGSNR